MTWDTIEVAHKAKVILGEDAITSMVLMKIATSVRSTLFIRDTRPRERFIGADFELWIESVQGKWLRYAVQAKKIDFKTGRYNSLAHQLPSAPFTPQIDLLQNYAVTARATALYCFYNNSNKPFRWNCSKPSNKKQLGCSVAPLSVVRAALKKRGGRSFEEIHKSPRTFPWRCLVCCRGKGLGHSSRFRGWPSEESNTHQSLPEELRGFDEGGIAVLKNASPEIVPGEDIWMPTFTLVVPRVRPSLHA